MTQMTITTNSGSFAAYPTLDDSSMRLKLPSLTLLVVALTACSATNPEEEQNAWEFGGRTPAEPSSSLTSKTVAAWSKREWPKACERLLVRYVVGKVPQKGRECELDNVTGYTPVATMRSRGTLRSSAGEQLPVAWTWQQVGNFHLKDFCSLNPIGEAEHLYVLVKSPPNRVWRLSLPERGPVTRVDTDAVKEICENLANTFDK